MRVTSATALRRNLAKMIDQAADDHVPLIVTRSGGKPAAVLMSLEDFNSYEETAHLVLNPRNAERLRASVEDLNRKR